MGEVVAAGLEYRRPDGRPLLRDVSFRVADGEVVALVGPPGSGKTTLLRLVAGLLRPQGGTVVVRGPVGLLPQAPAGGAGTVRELLRSVAQPGVRAAAEAVDAAELAALAQDDPAARAAYARALAEWGRVRGYEAEAVWDRSTTAVLGASYQRAQCCEVRSLPAGAGRRLMLEALLAGPERVLLLDELDAALDADGRRRLVARLVSAGRTVLFTTRERPAAGCDRVLLLGPDGRIRHPAGGPADAF